VINTLAYLQEVKVTKIYNVVSRNILEKMNARVEDLQAQLEAKSQVER
jgi:hypothetical protein